MVVITFGDKYLSINIFKMRLPRTDKTDKSIKKGVLSVLSVHTWLLSEKKQSKKPLS